MPAQLPCIPKEKQEESWNEKDNEMAKTVGRYDCGRDDGQRSCGKHRNGGR